MATFCAKYKNNCVSHVRASKALVGKPHSLTSRSLLMVKHETGNVTAKIRDPSSMSHHACIGPSKAGDRLNRTQLTLAQFESISKGSL